jgi:hypothetical protein
MWGICFDGLSPIEHGNRQMCRELSRLGLEWEWMRAELNLAMVREKGAGANLIRKPR